MADSTPAAPARPTVITLPDEIDVVNGGAIGEQLAGAFAGGAKLVIADMTATTFCDTLGARMLVLARQRAAASDAELRLLLPNSRAAGVWRILGLRTVLPIYQNLEDALAGAG